MKTALCLRLSASLRARRSKLRIKMPAWPLQLITWLLVAMQLLLPFSNELFAQQSTKPLIHQSNFSGPPPVLTPQNVRVNRTVPAVQPPSPNVTFSTNPSDAEIFSARVFSCPVVAVGPTKSAGENQALAQALLAFHHRADRDDASAIEAFLAAHPDSPRRISLLSHLASHYRATCQFSKALDLWPQIWALGSALPQSDVKAMVDQSVAEWATFLVTLGRMDELQALLQQLEGRDLRGSSGVLIDDAKSALLHMQQYPERAFKCGPYSLYRIRVALNLDHAAHQAIHDQPSTAQGTSLYQNWVLAQSMGMDYQMAKRQPGAAIPLPAMLHWKLGHCSAVIRAEARGYLIEDPTFAPSWISAQVLDEEASGYFLIPSGPLPPGWSPVSQDEAKTVYGRSTPLSSDPNAITPCDDKTCPQPAGGDGGMARYAVHLLRVSLNISDAPVGYQPPRGPAVVFRATYNERETNQPAVYNYSNLGNQWTFDWLSYIEDDISIVTNATIKNRVSGGGARVFAAIGTDFPIHPRSMARLVKTGPNSYEQTYPDGSKQVFALPTSTNSGPRKVFLTSLVDPAGNSVSLTYDNYFRIAYITDAIGQVTTLSYGSTNSSDSLFYKITQVTDPFSRYASFHYNGSGQLTNITDVIGLSSSFTYGSSDFINSLTTPYGTTTFTNCNCGGFSRWIEITDPLGAKERVEFRERSYPGVNPSELSSLFPVGISSDDGRLHENNTFHWDRRAMLEAPGDLTKARIIHWTSTPENYGVVGGVKGSEKNPLEARVWYQYPGQKVGDWSYVQSGTNDHPSKIGRVLDDGTTQLTQFEYNKIGKPTKAIDPLGRTTQLSYDGSNPENLLEVRQQIGASSTNTELLAKFTYNSQHLPLTAIDASGKTNFFGYNAYGQLTSVTNPLGQVISLNYATNGYLTNIDGSFPYAPVTITYDGYGRVRTVSNSDAYPVTYDYDYLDRPTKITFPDSTYQQMVYNKLDVVLSKDRRGRWSRSIYNARRQLTAFEDALGRITQLGWCDCGSLESVTDPLGRTTTWLRDLQGRPTAKIYPDATLVSCSYERTTSRVRSVTDAKNQMTVYDYFNDNNLKQIAYSNAVVSTPSVAFTYDTNYNRALTMTDGNGTTTYSYNPISTTPSLGAGRLSSVDGTLTNDTVAYYYDELGRLTNRAINGAAQTVSFDSLGRATTGTNALGSFTNAYVGVTARVSTNFFPNGQKAVFSYHDVTNDLRLKQIQNLTINTQLSAFSYTYDADGQIATWSQQADTGTTNLWMPEYDPVDQLIGVTVYSNTTAGPVLKQSLYNYDVAGNRTLESVTSGSTSTINTASHNALNQLTNTSGGGQLRFKGHLNEMATVSIAGNLAAVDSRASNFVGYATMSIGTNTVSIVATDYSTNSVTNRYRVIVTNGVATTLKYDSNGNLTNAVTATSTNNYEWDAANRLTKIIQLSTGNPQLVSQFAYDGTSRRVRIIERTNGVLQSDKRLVWCASNLSEERDSTGGAVSKRFFARGQQNSGTNYFFTMDHLGSIREMTDSSTGIRARYDYDPYGRRFRTSGDCSSDFGFTGHYSHSASSLSLTLFRAYDPDSGSWNSRDPIGEDGGPNLYAYVINDPIQWSDSLGLALDWSPRDHHNFVQQYENKFAKCGINIHDQKYLTQLPKWAHDELHARGWNDEIFFFFYEDPARQRTPQEAMALLARLQSENADLFQFGSAVSGHYRGYHRVQRLIGKLGKVLVALTILDIALDSDSYAQEIVGNLQMFAQDCQAGKDDWAYVDLLSLRNELNGLAPFSGDVAMRGLSRGGF